MSLSYKEVAEILKIIDASCCEELVLELENTRLVVRRGSAGDGVKNLTRKTESIDATQQKQTHSMPNTNVVKDATPASDDNSLIVRSPMAGTFFSRPSPEQASFVSEGMEVSIGDALCLIEVMKLYTTIEATTHGIIDSILVNDGDLVEFDQPLFVISKDDS